MKKFIPTVEQQAVLNYHDHMVITACPGSGKTAVVAEKVRAILPLLPDYKGVAAISYTKKASAELKRRCSADGIDTKKSFFGTIDSFSASEIVIPFLGHLSDKTPQEIEVKFFESLSDAGKEVFDDVSIKELAVDDVGLLLDRLIKLYLGGVLVMETIGVLAVYILDNSEACRRYLKSRYSALFIDEYQDSGNPQHELFVRFKSLGIVSVAVGDVDQSIFSFSHRDPKYIKALCEAGSGYKHLSLTINHRCHPSIVNYANRLLNDQCVLLPVDDIRVYRRSVTGTQIEAVQWINQVLPDMKKSFGVVHNREVGILVRNSNTAAIAANQLTCPSRLFGDNDLTRTPSLMSNFFGALLNFRFDNRITVQSIIDEFLRRRVKRDYLPILRKSIQNCRKCGLDIFSEAAAIAAENLFLGKPAQSVSNNLSDVLASADDLRYFEPIKDDEVQVMTLHKSKGLEFKIVFHLDLYDWVLPRRVFLQGNFDVIYENEQECLNLHYVGVTRAQEACVLLTSTRRLNFSNENKAGNPSQFYDRPGLQGLFQ
ncbi:ATP-dependent helicase [Duganella dendranthematis]|uniref:DNA 3'-5' helicase n=1 Tax=Duganella dendranthematis TaxID=2728021 RepID=A0ABX6MBK4_9BURK|nr:ATP-dependent helicase [Duganella dendranthematis]QJD91257.1 ATP-dependent helicase [Duganella dendranthematis]